MPALNGAPALRNIPPEPVGLLLEDGANTGRASAWRDPPGDRPHFPLLSEPPRHGPYLVMTAERLELRMAGERAMHPLYVDFNDAAIQRRVRGGRRIGIARALGLHRRPTQTVLDATCGLGRDTTVLLALGCRVEACERSPVIRALLADGLERANAPPASDWTQRLRLHPVDALDWLSSSASPAVDSIYIDPMFGAENRRALPKREMQMLHAAVGADTDAAELLAVARSSGAARVVVKRHPRHVPLAPPSYSIEGKRVVFDVYQSD